MDFESKRLQNLCSTSAPLIVRTERDEVRAEAQSRCGNYIGVRPTRRRRSSGCRGLWCYGHAETLPS